MIIEKNELNMSVVVARVTFFLGLNTILFIEIFFINTNIHNKQLHRDKKTCFREAYMNLLLIMIRTNTIECRHNNKTKCLIV